MRKSNHYIAEEISFGDFYREIIDVIWDKHLVFRYANGNIVKHKPTHNIKSFVYFFSHKKCSDLLSFISTCLDPINSEASEVNTNPNHPGKIIEKTFALLKIACDFVIKLKKKALSFTPKEYCIDCEKIYDAFLVYYRLSVFFNITDGKCNIDIQEYLDRPLLSNLFYQDNDFGIDSFPGFVYDLYKGLLHHLHIFEKKIGKRKPERSSYDESTSNLYDDSRNEYNIDISVIASNIYDSVIHTIKSPQHQARIFSGLDDIMQRMADNYPEVFRKPYNVAESEMVTKFDELKAFCRTPDALKPWFGSLYEEKYIHCLLLDILLNNKDFLIKLNSLFPLYKYLVYKDTEYGSQSEIEKDSPLQKIMSCVPTLYELDDFGTDEE